mmetsp:Transcript_98271/g.194684  ORF Transcript_98271/g.194684 Transcript_98271/m.194684 type:complete len:499 (+) Transcript_98271:54-1550(+)|eukprot:CAMPEP_0172666666 /NCGR_PEP_ID=MMETSP1074-20121228/7943_1 /TAXON_ID=2916 /ORGANISM="Ceratium fusus, Strain PA161109" /LENGTH=498 /DNA_ID=CAMNT_0013483081 /DNA_START=15 /DNA_END=1511 /DNA_ORIENTATION=+
MDLRRRHVAAGGAEVQEVKQREASHHDLHRKSGTASAELASPQEIALRHRGRPFAKLIHSKTQESLLSLRAAGTDFRGFFNLFVIVLVSANLRLVVENMLKYGVLLQPPAGFFDFYRNWPCGVCYIQMSCLTVCNWFIERHGCHYLKTDQAINAAHFVVISAIIVVPTCTVWSSSVTESNAVLLMAFSISWAMKMVSFFQTCFDIRRATARNIVDEVCKDDEASRLVLAERGFPQCLRLKDMLFFMLYPTLCFQLHYPLVPRIRKRRLAGDLLALMICIALSYILLEQYISPLLVNARQHVKMEAGPDGNVLTISGAKLLERLLKLSLPNLYLWLLMFYALFHCWLNVLAELTRFGDRRFYEDWWNAASFGEYWKRWNLPVHHWCLRHVYFPMLRRGWSKLQSGFTVFLISGLLHELLVVVPLRMKRPTVLVTVAFLAQLPLTVLTSQPFFEKRHRTIGNGIFWFAFCFSGQPAAILIYFFLAVDPSLETLGSVLSLR